MQQQLRSSTALQDADRVPWQRSGNAARRAADVSDCHRPRQGSAGQHGSSAKGSRAGEHGRAAHGRDGRDGKGGNQKALKGATERGGKGKKAGQ